MILAEEDATGNFDGNWLYACLHEKSERKHVIRFYTCQKSEFDIVFSTLWYIGFIQCFSLKQWI